MSARIISIVGRVIDVIVAGRLVSQLRFAAGVCVLAAGLLMGSAGGAVAVADISARQPSAPRPIRRVGQCITRALQKLADFDSLLGEFREDDLPMSRRDLSQRSFVDALVSGFGNGGGFLDRIETAFDWSAFEALLAPIHASVRAAPALSAAGDVQDPASAAMVHALRSGAEEAVRDRLSFRRFCGLPLEEEAPDHASIWRFRQTLDKLAFRRRCSRRRTASSRRGVLSSSAAR